MLSRQLDNSGLQFQKDRKGQTIRQEENLKSVESGNLVKYTRENGSILLSVADRFNKMKTKD